MANLLLGMSTMYRRRFETLWNSFDKVCNHGGIFLEEELVTVAQQHRDYDGKLDEMLDGDEKFGDFKDENPNAQSNTQRET